MRFRLHVKKVQHKVKKKKMGKDAIKFTKMQGAGNDYVYIDATSMEKIPANMPLLARQISDRHFGVGSDGLVVIMTSSCADFRMRMFNADGSESEMCGNASRCIGKYVYEKGLTDKTTVTLETLAGIRTLILNTNKGKVESVEVDMGMPITEPEKVPVAVADRNPVINREFEHDGMLFKLTAVSMGNPHGVIFTDAITDFQIFELGPKLEKAPFFPNKANIEFVKVNDRKHIEMRVWERGTGETLACGTGACASVVAAILNGLCDRDVEVKLPGGTLHIRWDENDGHVYLCGGAEFVAEGTFYPHSAKSSGII